MAWSYIVIVSFALIVFPTSAQEHDTRGSNQKKQVLVVLNQEKSFLAQNVKSELKTMKLTFDTKLAKPSAICDTAHKNSENYNFAMLLYDMDGQIPELCPYKPSNKLFPFLMLHKFNFNNETIRDGVQVHNQVFDMLVLYSSSGTASTYASKNDPEVELSLIRQLILLTAFAAKLKIVSYL
ncbi:unnamed protein product [Bursaphelenchus okinawaensis]|uniref:Uncharacterized protein n=1 Tax=Bursaphelenchus okinawaensis TaxID=465554 RepID=A0A811K8Z0_9BILA|nr:unnamed protein product [Bursaphelenchus okinawaensis]CAG9094458.1 unnamed protein product [Bursaphelenchus okinawaensis]